MAQTFEQLIDGNTQFRNLYNYVQGSLNTLKSQFSGTSAPNSPVAGQQWFNTTDNNTYQYKVDLLTGIGYWDNTSPTELQAEIELARGTNASLNARLSIGINGDGTFKEAVPVTANTWVNEENTITYLTTATFKVNGDVRSVYIADRAIKLTQTTSRTSYVSSTALDAGNTVITVKGGAVDSGLTAVAYSTMVKENQPYITPTTSDTTKATISDLVRGCSGFPAGIATTTTYTTGAGFCTSDDYSTILKLTANITKNLGIFVVGNNNGSLDAGTVSADTWYYSYIIYNPTTQVNDILMSLSASAPTMPSGFTKKRRIGSFKTNSSSQVTSFIRRNGVVTFGSPYTAYAGNGSTSNYATTMGVPTGIDTYPIFSSRVASQNNIVNTLIAQSVIVGEHEVNTCYSNTATYTWNQNTVDFIPTANGIITFRNSTTLTSGTVIVTHGYKEVL